MKKLSYEQYVVLREQTSAPSPEEEARQAAIQRVNARWEEYRRQYEKRKQVNNKARSAAIRARDRALRAWSRDFYGSYAEDRPMPERPETGDLPEQIDPMKGYDAWLSEQPDNPYDDNKRSRTRDEIDHDNSDYDYQQMEKGGEGSGNFEHEGRPGEVGGSAPDNQGKNSYTKEEADKKLKELKDEINTVIESPGLLKRLGTAGAEITGSFGGTIAGWETGKILGPKVLSVAASRLGVSSPILSTVLRFSTKMPIVKDIVTFAIASAASSTGESVGGPLLRSLYEYLIRGGKLSETDLKESFVGIYLPEHIREAYNTIYEEAIEKGGEGSGNFEHEGRPGEVGGSSPSGRSTAGHIASTAASIAGSMAGFTAGVDATAQIAAPIVRAVAKKIPLAAKLIGLALPIPGGIVGGMMGGAVAEMGVNLLLDYLNDKGVETPEDIEQLSPEDLADAPTIEDAKALANFSSDTPTQKRQGNIDKLARSVGMNPDTDYEKLDDGRYAFFEFGDREEDLLSEDEFRKLLQSISTKKIQKGGIGSGFWGHSGRKGQWGGSAYSLGKLPAPGIQIKQQKIMESGLKTNTPITYKEYKLKHLEESWKYNEDTGEDEWVNEGASNQVGIEHIPERIKENWAFDDYSGEWYWQDESTEERPFDAYSEAPSTDNETEEYQFYPEEIPIPSGPPLPAPPGGDSSWFERLSYDPIEYAREQAQRLKGLPEQLAAQLQGVSIAGPAKPTISGGDERSTGQTIYEREYSMSPSGKVIVTNPITGEKKQFQDFQTAALYYETKPSSEGKTDPFLTVNTDRGTEIRLKHRPEPMRRGGPGAPEKFGAIQRGLPEREGPTPYGVTIGGRVVQPEETPEVLSGSGTQHGRDIYGPPPPPRMRTDTNELNLPAYNLNQPFGGEEFKQAAELARLYPEKTVRLPSLPKSQDESLNVQALKNMDAALPENVRREERKNRQEERQARAEQIDAQRREMAFAREKAQQFKAMKALGGNASQEEDITPEFSGEERQTQIERRPSQSQGRRAVQPAKSQSELRTEFMDLAKRNRLKVQERGGLIYITNPNGQQISFKSFDKAMDYFRKMQSGFQGTEYTQRIQKDVGPDTSGSLLEDNCARIGAQCMRGGMSGRITIIIPDTIAKQFDGEEEAQMWLSSMEHT